MMDCIGAINATKTRNKLDSNFGWRNSRATYGWYCQVKRTSVDVYLDHIFNMLL